MKRHLVTLHCGQQYLALNPGQRYCNKKCAAFFSTRRNFSKRQKKDGVNRISASNCLDSSDPKWEEAKRYLTSKAYWNLVIHILAEGVTICKLEHIVVWERWHGKKVPRGWVIHHVNEERLDNDPMNLMALPKGLHRELHVKLKHLRQQCCGFEYALRRRDLADEFLRRATQLDDLRRQWRLEGN